MSTTPSAAQYAAQAPDGVVVVDLGAMTRRTEVVNYAYRRNIDLADALIELVNEGLSHQREDYTK